MRPTVPTLRRFAAAAATCSFLLAGLTAAAGHEHAFETFLAAKACFADHSEAEHYEQVDRVGAERIAGPGSGPALSQHGEEHEHECVACQISRDRGLVPSKGGGLVSLCLASGTCVASPRETSGRWVSSNPPRGPPETLQV